MMYNDENNLYRWAKSQSSPFGPFNWVDEDRFNQIDWEAQRAVQAVGYIVECELEYPCELHDMDNNYKMALIRLNIQVEILSDT